MINSQGHNLNQFIKTSAPCWHCVPTLAPSPPPVGGPSALVVRLLASTAGLQVQDTRTWHSSTDTPVTPMAVDPAPPPSALSPSNWDLSALTPFNQLILKRDGLVAYNKVRSISGEPPLFPGPLLLGHTMKSMASHPPPVQPLLPCLLAPPWLMPCLIGGPGLHNAIRPTWDI